MLKIQFNNFFNLIVHLGLNSKEYKGSNLTNTVIQGLFNNSPISIHNSEF